jgi:heterodisulfide reductase subunit C
VKIKELSGEDAAVCYQCGLCSAICLMASEMDAPLRVLIRFAQLGRVEVLELKDIWVCLSCLVCQVKCPRGINLPRFIDTLRQIKFEKGAVKYTVFCKNCGRLFLTTPILDYLKKCLENREMKEDILNLCPTCRRAHFMESLLKHRAKH